MLVELWGKKGGERNASIAGKKARGRGKKRLSGESQKRGKGAESYFKSWRRRSTAMGCRSTNTRKSLNSSGSSLLEAI